jgi:hypothetical protein
MRIAVAGTSFSPLPYKTWHGYMVTIAHRVELEVGADGTASAPPSGAAAVVPPLGAAKVKLNRACKGSKTYSTSFQSTQRLVVTCLRLSLSLLER